MTNEKKSGTERTQPATRDETWEDDRLKKFLDLEPPANIPADYAILLKAYRGMTADLFARFAVFFVEAGRDINIRLDNGKTFLDHISQHRRSAEYVAALKTVGAKKESEL